MAGCDAIKLNPHSTYQIKCRQLKGVIIIMNISKESGLQKELSRSRSKVRILEFLLIHGCDLRDCPFSVKREIGWAAPEIKYSIAVSFRAFENQFIIYGDDEAKIQAVASFYAKEKYEAPATKIKIEDQSPVGRIIDRGNVTGEVVGLYPYIASEFSFYIVSHEKGIWILGADELSKIKDFEIDWDSSEYGLDSESERSLNAD